MSDAPHSGLETNPVSTGIIKLLRTLPQKWSAIWGTLTALEQEILDRLIELDLAETRQDVRITTSEGEVRHAVYQASGDHFQHNLKVLALTDAKLIVARKMTTRATVEFGAKVYEHRLTAEGEIERYNLDHDPVAVIEHIAWKPSVQLPPEFAELFDRPKQSEITDVAPFKCCCVPWSFDSNSPNPTSETAMETPVDVAGEVLNETEANILQALSEANRPLKGESLASAALGKTPDGKFKSDCSAMARRGLITSGRGRASQGYSITPKGRALLAVRNGQDHSWE